MALTRLFIGYYVHQDCVRDTFLSWPNNFININNNDSLRHRTVIYYYIIRKVMSAQIVQAHRLYYNRNIKRKR